MAVFFNETGAIGQAILSVATNVTGDLFTTLFILILVLLCFALGAGIPLIWTAIIVVPVVVTAMAFSSQFLALGGLLGIYLALVLAQNYFTNR